MNLGQTPYNEIVSGIIFVVALIGTIFLAFTNKMIPTPLSAIDAAALLYYTNARSFNVGMQHGTAVTREEESNK